MHLAPPLEPTRHILAGGGIRADHRASYCRRRGRLRPPHAAGIHRRDGDLGPKRGHQHHQVHAIVWVQRRRQKDLCLADLPINLGEQIGHLFEQLPFESRRVGDQMAERLVGLKAEAPLVLQAQVARTLGFVEPLAQIRRQQPLRGRRLRELLLEEVQIRKAVRVREHEHVAEQAAVLRAHANQQPMLEQRKLALVVVDALHDHALALAAGPA